MKIAGFQAMTLSDFPGHIAAIVFTQGCNFRCPFCHNGNLIPAAPTEKLMDTDLLMDRIVKYSDMLEGVVVTGGEPTIQPDIADFMRKLHRSGLKVKLDTNGSRPDVLKALLADALADYVAMDVKAPLCKEKYDQLTGINCSIEKIQQSIEMLSDCSAEVEFRTTFVPSLLSDEDIAKIKSSLPAGCKYTVQKFIPDNVLNSSVALQTAF